jgi:hypothetical protein
VIKNISKPEWFLSQNYSVNGKYQPVFAEILTPNGIGYAFNMLDAEEMMNFER